MTDTTTQELDVLQTVADVIDPEGLLAPMHGGWWSRQYPGRVNRVAILEDDALALWTDWARRWIEKWCDERSEDLTFVIEYGSDAEEPWCVSVMNYGIELYTCYDGPSLAHALAAAIGQLKEKT